MEKPDRKKLFMGQSVLLDDGAKRVFIRYRPSKNVKDKKAFCMVVVPQDGKRIPFDGKLDCIPTSRVVENLGPSFEILKRKRKKKKPVVPMLPGLA